MVGLVRVDRDCVLDTRHPWRCVLADAVQMHLRTAILKVNYGRHAFNALDHAGSKGGQEKLRGVEGIRASRKIRIQSDLGAFAFCSASVSVRSISIHRV